MEILGILFAFTAIIWLLYLVRATRLPVQAMAILFIGTFFGPPFFAWDGPPQISIDRMLWCLLILVFVIHWRLGWTDFKPMTRNDTLLIFLVGWLAIGTQRGGPVPDESVPFARWLFYVAIPFSMYWIAKSAFVKPSDLRKITTGFVLVGTYLSILGMLEMQGFHQWVFPQFIVDPIHTEFLGRARGPLLNPAANGIVITASLGAAISLAIQANRIKKLVYLFAVGILCLGLAATLTRGVWLGAILAALVIVAFYIPRWARVLGAATVLLLCFALVAGLKDQLLSLKRDEGLSASAAAKSIQLRPLLAVLAWEMFKDHPITGVGYGHYFEHVTDYYDDHSYDMPLEMARGYMQHNVFLSLLVDSGLIGLVVFLIVGIGWLVNSIRLARSQLPDPITRHFGFMFLAMLLGYTVNGMFQDVSVMAMVHMFLFYVAGLAAGVTHTLAVSKSTEDRVENKSAYSAHQQSDDPVLA